MKTRMLGKSCMAVSAVGMGCMGFSHGYGATPAEGESIRLIRKAYELGCTFFDTAEGYGPFVNEELVGKTVAPLRDTMFPKAGTRLFWLRSFLPSRLPGRSCPKEN